MPNDVLQLSVKLKSGQFESSLNVPLDDDEDAAKDAIEAWLSMIGYALKAGITDLAATFGAAKLKGMDDEH